MCMSIGDVDYGDNVSGAKASLNGRKRWSSSLHGHFPEQLRGHFCWIPIVGLSKVSLPRHARPTAVKLAAYFPVFL